jgi:DNA modification methylase
MTVQILLGDCRDVLRTLPADSVHCVVCSPPYWGLRSYIAEGDPLKSFEIGLEPTYGEYIDKIVAVFREVRRVLRPDGTLWLNLGDSYATGTAGARKPTATGKHGYWENPAILIDGAAEGLKPKDLVGIPWRVAFALQADGWWLRQDIIWLKPNPMPESVTDRCTKAHEYLFLLSKSERYYYDQDAILEACSPNTHARLSQDVQAQIGSDRVPGKTNGNMKAVLRKQDSTNASFVPGASEHKGLHRAGTSRSGRESWKGSSFDGPRDLAVRPDTGRKRAPAGSGIKNNDSFAAATCMPVLKRNKRSVWSVVTQPFSEAHFATFPPALIEPCILAGCPEGGTCLDPFGGAGTTGLVADRLKRNAILIELNEAYALMAKRRIETDAGLFGRVELVPSAQTQSTPLVCGAVCPGGGLMTIDPIRGTPGACDL